MINLDQSEKDILLFYYEIAHYLELNEGNSYGNLQYYFSKINITGSLKYGHV